MARRFTPVPKKNKIVEWGRASLIQSDVKAASPFFNPSRKEFLDKGQSHRAETSYEDVATNTFDRRTLPNLEQEKLTRAPKEKKKKKTSPWVFAHYQRCLLSGDFQK